MNITIKFVSLAIVLIAGSTTALATGNLGADFCHTFVFQEEGTGGSPEPLAA